MVAIDPLTLVTSGVHKSGLYTVRPTVSPDGEESGAAGQGDLVTGYGRRVEFRMLGPLEVRREGQRVALGGRQVEKLLAGLLLASGRVVSVDELVETLWDGEPPVTARQQIHKSVAALRRKVPGVVITDGPGYRLALTGAGATLDAAQFDRLANDATIPSLTAALGLWRGAALAGIDGRVIRARAVWLEERRLVAAEKLAELRIDAGESAAVAIELPALIAAHPWRESLRVLLMLALYRSGRQADALAAYADVRTVLCEELGLDPGPELARLHEQILRADPSLGARIRTAPSTLPYDVPGFVGRASELACILGEGRIHVVEGLAGIGKTALVVHAAHRLADRHPDGQLFVDLHGFTPGRSPVDPLTALEQLLRTLGVPPARIPDGIDARSAAWRSETAGRKLVVVLDNAVDADQVRPILPGSSTCRTLITCRVRLAELVDVTTVALDVLSPREARALFAEAVGPHRIADEEANLERVLELCGRVPLAVRLAASRLAHRPLWSVGTLAGKLAAAADPGIGTALAVSYDHLPPDEQPIVRLLACHPGPDFDAFAVAAVAEVHPDEADRLLENILDAHLLEQRSGDRYSFHDLVRRYARMLAPDEAATERARQRLHDYYLTMTTAAMDVIDRAPRWFEPAVSDPPEHRPDLPDRAAAWAWLAAEYKTLLALCETSRDWQLAAVLRTYFERTGQFGDWRRTHERALENLRDADHLGAAILHHSLGSVEGWSGRPEQAIAHFHEALTASRGDPGLAGPTLNSLGMALHLAGRDIEAEGFLREALTIEGRSPRLTSLALGNLGLVNARLGRRAAALDLHHEAIALARGSAAPTVECAAELGLGETLLRIDEPDPGPFEHALALARANEHGIQEAIALDGLAHVTGEPEYWWQALGIFARLGVAQAQLVRAHLADPTSAHCDLCRASSPVNGARQRSASGR